MKNEAIRKMDKHDYYRVFKKIVCVKSLTFYYYENFDTKLKSISNEAEFR